jgi:hypothetical protein
MGEVLVYSWDLVEGSLEQMISVLPDGITAEMAMMDVDDLIAFVEFALSLKKPRSILDEPPIDWSDII